MLAAFLVAGAGSQAAAAKRARSRPDPRGAEIGATVQSFGKRNRGRKGEAALDNLIQRIGEEVLEFQAGGEQESPRLRTLRGFVKSAAPLGAPEASTRRKSKAVRNSGSVASSRAFPLPQQIRYRFGARDVVAVDRDDKQTARELKKKGGFTEASLPATHRLEMLLHGCLPETELALAMLQRELDVDERGDQLALFLDSWRNQGPDGDESFYEALDRTAGTPKEVFFYDAMLGEFVAEFAAQEGKRWNLGTRHDRLQQAFLSYRQYRGMIEAASYALLLPPAAALPGRLKRYDYQSVSPGALSFRHQVDLLVEFHDGEVDRVIAFLKQFLEDNPMPEEPWGVHDPIGSFARAFLAQARVHVERLELSTDELLEARRAREQDLARRIRAGCTSALAEL